MYIGLDVGGTHTDVVRLEGRRVVARAKLPTADADLARTVIDGLSTVLEGEAPLRVERLVLSTTLATNRVVTGNLAPVGVLVAAGPGLDPRLFSCGAHYEVVAGALDHRGAELAPVDPDEVKAAAGRIREKGIGNLAVIGKFSTRNPAHEIAIAKAAGPFGTVVPGHAVSGQLNFPRRIATAALHAAVAGPFREFAGRIREAVAALGIRCPIHVLKADGGTLLLDRAEAHPAETILSGPAASMMGALSHAGSGDTLVLDIGGTTTDMGILVDGVPLLEPLGGTLSGSRTLIRCLRTTSVGIGGDSEVRLEENGLAVGPLRKGPAACKGGPVPTPTDAMRILELVTDGDRSKAEDALRPLAVASGLSLEGTAGRILDAMAAAISDAAQEMVATVNGTPVYTLKAFLDGHHVAPSALLVMGGPAGVMAGRIGAACGIPATPVPDWGVANAVGAGLSRTTCSVTLFADTQKRVARAPEEGFETTIDRTFSLETAKSLAHKLVTEKARKLGGGEAVESEIVEALSFPMIRGYRKAGDNIRVTAQVTPGLAGGDA